MTPPPEVIGHWSTQIKTSISQRTLLRKKKREGGKGKGFCRFMIDA